ncbi:hypothetical protein ACSLPA_32140, partial [Escherichia coli]
RSEHRTAQNDKFSPPGWKVLHGDFRSHLPHGIFVTLQKKARQADSDAFFMFTLVFPCLFVFFASESD